MNESLLKENLSKEREIRRLNKDMHQYEQKLIDLRKEISSTKCSSACATRDVAVSAGICCSDRLENGGGECKLSVALKDEAGKCQEKMRAIETKLKSSNDNVFALRKVNVTLSEELHALRRVCAALDEQCRASNLRAKFKDEIIREMRRQLKQAKTKVSCQALLSATPARSACAAHSDPDVSSIERDPSVQNISADSREKLERLLYRDCCLSPSSIMLCAQQARMLSASTGSLNFVPTVGLALSNITNGGHSPSRTRHTVNTSACDCSNIAHSLDRNPLDKRCLVERLLSYTSSPDINTKDEQKSSKFDSSSKSPEQERKTSKKSQFAGFFKKNKSTKTSESSDDQNSPDRESKNTKIKKDKKNKSHKSSKSNDSDEDDKGATTSKKSLFHKDSKSSNSFRTLKKSHTKHERHTEKSSKQNLAQENKKSKDSSSSHDSGSSSKKEKKSLWKRQKKEKDKKSDLSSDSGESGLVNAGTGTAVLSPVDVGVSICTKNSTDSLLCEKVLPISSCPNSPCGSPRPDPWCKSYPCSPRKKTSCSLATKLCPAKSLLPCTSKPCPRLLKPCSCSQNSSSCRSPTHFGSNFSSGITCPGISSTSAPKPCPVQSLLKPCAHSVSPPCGLSGFKISSLLPCPFNTSSPCATKPPCDTKPTCVPKSPCDPKLPCNTEPACVLKSPCDPKKPCTPKSCPAKSRPCIPLLTPCQSPRDSEESLINTTLTKLSTLLSGPCKTSTPCPPKSCPAKSSVKPCSRSQNNSPCRSPTISEGSSLIKTFPCASKPCPVPSAPCTRKPCPSGISPCIDEPCPSKPCIRKTPYAPNPSRSKPCNEISPCHSPLSSPDSSCIDICSLSKDPCEQEAPCEEESPCESTFNPFDFLKKCVQFLPGNEDLKPLCPQVVCPRAEAVCPTITEETDASTDCYQGADKCILTQEESSEMAGVCDAARAQYYRNKFLSTQQIIENKEETIRIQGESLAVAESRLATLTIRAGQLRQELECKSKELRMLRRAMSGCRCKTNERTESCAGGAAPPAPCADLQKHKNVVITLQTNLSIIEELYRECFYETAKQEALIEKLRQSYLDVRLSDKQKSDEIGRLQNVVNTQKWSLDQCQDIVMEVEGLKMEISNFLNNSNNDSGMWERSEDSAAPPDVGEDLQQITEQLLQLKHLLHQDDPLLTELSNENCKLKCENNELTSENCRLKCENDELTTENCRLKCENDELTTENCRLKCENDELITENCRLKCENDESTTENCRLKCENDELTSENNKLTDENCRLQCDNKEWEAQIDDYRQKVCEFEFTIQNNEEVIDSLNREKECTENQLRCAQNQVQALTQRVSELECAEEKISEFQHLLNATNQKLERALEQICHHECTETALRAQLEEAKQLAEENERIGNDLCALQHSVRTWHAQLQDSQARVHALQAELHGARARADTADLNYRQQVEMATELQQQLREAHERGAALCEESRRVVCAVRQWVRDSCDKRRELDEKIKRQQTIIWTLNNELEETQCCCAPPPSHCGPSRAVGCAKCGRARERERQRCGLATCPTLHVKSETRVGEAPSCSSGPVPPRRLLKKKSRACSERCVSRRQSAGAQQPEGTRDAATCTAPAPPAPPAPPARCGNTHNVRHLRLAGCVAPSVSPPQPRGQSPSQDLLRRVENLHDALVSGQRRWGRPPDPAPADGRS